MEDKIGKEYVRRTQKDYSMYFKLQVVQEVERGGDMGIFKYLNFIIKQDGGKYWL